MEFDTLYKIDSNPLEIANGIVLGEEYCTNDGVTIKYITNDDIEIVKGSPLVDGELIVDLTPKQLGLFWKLRRNNLLRG